MPLQIVEPSEGDARTERTTAQSGEPPPELKFGWATMQPVWGVSRGSYEFLTLATLAVVFAVAVIGYLLGGSVRRETVTVPLEAADEAAPA